MEKQRTWAWHQKIKLRRRGWSRPSRPAVKLLKNAGLAAEVLFELLL